MIQLESTRVDPEGEQKAPVRRIVTPERRVDIGRVNNGVRDVEERSELCINEG